MWRDLRRHEDPGDHTARANSPPELERERGVPKDHRDDRGLRRTDIDPGRRKAIRQTVAIGPQQIVAFGLRLDDIQRSRWDDTEVRHWGELFGGPFPAPSTVARRLRQQMV